MKRGYFLLFLSAIVVADDTNLEKVLYTVSNHFTGNFFSKVVKENHGKSIAVSAYSVMTPLALLSLASVGPSHDELLNAIGLPNDNITKSVFSFAETKLRSIKGVELKAANRIYIPVGYELNSEFAAVSRDTFNSEVKNINFLKNVDAANEINEWDVAIAEDELNENLVTGPFCEDTLRKEVEDQTNHRIKNLVDPDSIDGNTRAILVNALYFKGTWKTLFVKSFTSDSYFHVTKHDVIKVPMMNNIADYKYIMSEKLQSRILEIPYVGEQTSLMLLLPYKIDSIAQLLEKLRDISVLDEETKYMFEVEVDISIPKFKIETTTDLKKILQKMNIKKLFRSEEALLNKILERDKNLYISSATQKVFMEINEEGTEAAAANQMGLRIIGGELNRFNANHPFVFLLKEKNNILFSGIYNG